MLKTLLYLQSVQTTLLVFIFQRVSFGQVTQPKQVDFKSQKIGSTSLAGFLPKLCGFYFNYNRNILSGYPRDQIMEPICLPLNDFLFHEGDTSNIALEAERFFSGDPRIGACVGSLALVLAAGVMISVLKV